MKHTEAGIVSRLYNLGYENWVKEIDKHKILYEVAYHLNNTFKDEETSDNDFLRRVYTVCSLYML